MFKIGDIVRFIEDDDEWKIIGVGREGGDIAYMVIKTGKILVTL